MHHFIKDSYEKRLIEMVKIHIDHNVADLLTKAFDVSRFNFLVASIGKRGRDTKIPQSGGSPIKVGDEVVHKELSDRIERAATTVSSLEAEQDSEFCDMHNMVAYLEKSEGSEGFHQIIDFLNASHIQANGEVELAATIDGQVKTITEASLRRHLKLEDNGGVTTLPNLEIFEQLALMGRHLQPHTRTYAAHSLTNKVFSNMKRVSRGYSRVEFPLFPTMLTAPETSPSRITSSPSLSPEPSLSPQHTPVSTPSTLQPPNTQPTPDVEEAAPMPYESPLQSVHSLGRDEGSLSLTELTVLCTSLSKKVEGLESELKKTKQTYSIVLTKLIKRGRKISTIDKDPTISLVQPEHEMEHGVSTVKETSWIQEDVDIQIRTSNDTEVLLEEEPTKLVEDRGSGEKVYIRRSAEKRKDKGKGIITEPEPEKKTELQQRQERASLEATIRLEEQFNEEESQRIARDAEIAK
ncbi:hypothetical protein Tco_1382384, partial [Tanacetum coccineum]